MSVGSMMGARWAPQTGAARAIALLALLQAVVFLAVILLPPEEMSPGGYPYSEEWRRGLAAREWMIGPLLPHLDYVLGTHTNGTLLASAAAVISFAIFGSSVVALRLPNLLLWWGALTCLFLFVDRTYGRRAALFTGLLTVAASPCYMVIGAAVWASHIEGNTFIVLMLFLWVRHVFGGHDRMRDALVLGIAAGFGTWYHYATVVWFVPALVIELMLDRRALFERRMLVRLAGFPIGFLPWIIYNATHGWEGLGIYGMGADDFVRPSLAHAGKAFVNLWIEYLPGAISMPDALGIAGSGKAIDVVLVALATLAWLWLAKTCLGALRRGIVMPALVFVLYPPLWAVLYCFGSLHGQPGWMQGYRYMISLFPVAWVAGGMALAHLANGPTASAARAPAPSSTNSAGRGRPYLARALGGGAAIVLLCGMAGYLRPDRFEVNWNAPGFQIEGVGRWLFTRRGAEPEKVVPAVEKLLAERDPLEVDMALFTLANSLHRALLERPERDASADERRALLALRGDFMASLKAVSAAVPPRYKPYFSALRPGERPWHWAEREQFWEQWDLRGLGRPPGAFAHP